MNCVKSVVDSTAKTAYSHHIQRLMITGNLALLLGINPREVHEWYLAVYDDAYEWVELPNTLGMALFADGGLMSTKPYIASGNYINKMSDYCKKCRYKVAQKTGEDACPFNPLYWHFMDTHRETLSKNHRIGRIYATWDRMGEEKQRAYLDSAEAVLNALEPAQSGWARGEPETQREAAE